MHRQTVDKRQIKQLTIQDLGGQELDITQEELKQIFGGSSTVNTSNDPILPPFHPLYPIDPVPYHHPGANPPPPMPPVHSPL